MSPVVTTAEPQRYAVTLVCPPGYPHSLALIEIAETLHYALQALGYDSIVTDKLDEPGRRHILLGANLLPKFEMGRPKPGTIIYNFEQIDSSSAWIDEAYLGLLKTHEVWDYSERNIALLRDKGIRNIQLMPVGHVPELERIPPAPVEDIDVLFYGSINERRQRVLDDLRARGLKVEQVFGLYGADRDALVARAKVVLNLHFYESKIFEIARVSYLLTNGVCVLSETGLDPAEQEFADAVAFASYEELADACVALVNDPDRRARLREHGRHLMRQRPQAPWLARLLAGSQPIPASSSPAILNLGCRYGRREDAINIDNNPDTLPDILFDLNTPLPPGGITFETKRFGVVALRENQFDLITAHWVLEKTHNLAAAMNTCLSLLKEGGILHITVPYDLSWSAWQDPYTVRAFNENSWQWYTDEFWRMGWTRWRFTLASLRYNVSPAGELLAGQGIGGDELIRTPRAVESMDVKLCKRQLTEAERMTTLRDTA